MASDRKDTPAMRARTEYAYSNEVYGTLQRMLAKLLEAMPEKVRFTHRKFASSFGMLPDRELAYSSLYTRHTAVSVHANEYAVCRKTRTCFAG